jgi:trehalose 6-phosphate synthase/phosphatase
VLALIHKLAADPSNRVVVVSGRGPRELEAWFGHLPVALSGEHGVFFREPGREWQSALNGASPWKEALLPLFHALAERCPGALVQEKSASLAWHYRGSERDLGFLRSRELIDRLNGLASEMGFRVAEGDLVVEARPLGIDKGGAVRDILRIAGRPDLILALGDDRTDEDMFGALPPEAWSIRVGMKPSLARFNLRHQRDVVPLLQQLSQAGMAALRP